nr:type II secretion system protein GspG [Luteolibacter marinus]
MPGVFLLGGNASTLSESSIEASREEAVSCFDGFLPGNRMKHLPDMIAVAVMVLTAAVLMGWLIPFPGEGAHIAPARSEFQSLSSALKTYKINAGHYPTTEQGLHALVERPTVAPFPRDWVKIAKSVPTDPWKNEYRYHRLPDDDPRGFEIISLGPDGVPSDDDRSSLDE